jgi:hypothetical protein
VFSALEEGQEGHSLRKRTLAYCTQCYRWDRRLPGMGLLRRGLRPSPRSIDTQKPVDRALAQFDGQVKHALVTSGNCLFWAFKRTGSLMLTGGLPPRRLLICSA